MKSLVTSIKKNTTYVLKYMVLLLLLHYNMFDIII